MGDKLASTFPGPEYHLPIPRKGRAGRYFNGQPVSPPTAILRPAINLEILVRDDHAFPFAAAPKTEKSSGSAIRDRHPRDIAEIPKFSRDGSGSQSPFETVPLHRQEFGIL
jgi:hypothetical protein